MKQNIFNEGHSTDRKDKYIPMILMNSEINSGEMKQFIDDIEDPVIKEMAYAEYCYFTGNHEENVAITEKYLNSKDVYVRVSAWLMYTFSNLTLCNTPETLKGIEFIKALIEAKDEKDSEIQALIILVANAASVLLHLQVKEVPPIEHNLQYLPMGFRIWGCYIMAHQSYLKGEYDKGIGIVETCMYLNGEKHIIPLIYLYLSGAMNSVSSGNLELGKEYFLKAFELAKRDELIEPIGEHHGLLHGLVESCLKKSDKSYYERIIYITYKFSYGWRRIHNPITNEDVADTLTTTEFTVAMLANKGWTNSEIAEYLGLNINTVKRHITNIFNKLNISSRKQLKPFMLR